jgi:hypothetical protein
VAVAAPPTRDPFIVTAGDSMPSQQSGAAVVMIGSGGESSAVGDASEVQQEVSSLHCYCLKPVDHKETRNVGVAQTEDLILDNIQACSQPPMIHVSDKCHRHQVCPYGPSSC